MTTENIKEYKVSIPTELEHLHHPSYKTLVALLLYTKNDPLDFEKPKNDSETTTVFKKYLYLSTFNKIEEDLASMLNITSKELLQEINRLCEDGFILFKTTADKDDYLVIKLDIQKSFVTLNKQNLRNVVSLTTPKQFKTYMILAKATLSGTISKQLTREWLCDEMGLQRTSITQISTHTKNLEKLGLIKKSLRSGSSSVVVDGKLKHSYKTCVFYSLT